MLSGNGRHRRPRQAPALVIAAGVTGTALAIPLLGATGAVAATGTTWDQVANCETGGSWSEDSGDGRYGGLHIAQEDWEEYGGLDYAARADLASRNQQIAVAEKILDDRGVSYWSTCGPLNGLGEDSEEAEVDTGVGNGGSDTSGESESSDSSGSSGSSGSAESSGSSGSSDSSTPSAETSPESSTDTDNSTKSDTSSESDSDPGSGNGSGSGDSASPGGSSTGSTKQDNSDGSGGPDGSDGSGGANGADGSGDSGDDSWREGSISSLVDTGALDTSGAGKHRGDSAQEGAGEGAKGSGGAGASTGRHAADGDSYTVRRGDSLESIADSLDLQGGWRALYEENKETVGADPGHIVPGQTLLLDAE